MFRDNSKSPINLQNFGAGSTIHPYNGTMYLVVADDTDSAVYLVDLRTMSILQGRLKVEDVNHLTKEEAGALSEFTKLNYTFSDFTFDPKGLKLQVN